MITIKYLADLEGAEKYGTCNSCGKDSSKDKTMVKVESMRKQLGGCSSGLSVFLCDDCRDELRKRLEDKGGNMTRKEAKRNLTYAKKWGDIPESDALDIAIRSIEIVEKIERLTTMYAQKGNAPTRTITMEELRGFIN